MPKSISNDVFVGREKELIELCQLLDETREGVGSIALVAGEPGIGKTFLLNQLRNYARSSEVNVYVGFCSDDEGAPPYWPLVQALRPHIEDCPEEALRSQLGATASIVAEAMPIVRLRLPDLPPHKPDLNPERARFRLFDALAQFLRRAAHEQPILLVLEDLHWADESSLKLISFVSRQLERMSLMVTGSYRDVELRRTHPLYRVLGEIATERRYTRVRLRGWAEADTARYLALAGGDLQESLVSELHDQTEGTPLFVAEVVRLLADEDQLRPQIGHTRLAIRLPEGVREAIGRRLDRLSADCNRVLAAAAVVGQHFSASVLRHVLTLEGRAVFEALDEAVVAQVIDAASSLPEEYSFRHALVQQTLLEEIPVAARARRHGEVALALEQLLGDVADTHAAEIARHLELAGELGDEKKLVHYASIAGEQALAAYAYEEAQDHFDHALRALGEETESIEAARLWHGFGRACVYSDDDRGMPAIERGFDLCDALGEYDLAIEIAFSFSDVISTDDKRMRRALEITKPGNANQVRMIGNLALWTAYHRGDDPEIDSLLSEANSIVDELGDSRLLLEALVTHAITNACRGHWKAALKDAGRAVDLAESVGDDLLNYQAHLRLSVIYMWNDQHSRGLEAGRRAITIAERMGDRWQIGLSCMYHARSLYDYGEFQEAHECVDRALEMNPDHYWAISVRAALELQIGKLETSEHHLQKKL